MPNPFKRNKPGLSADRLSGMVRGVRTRQRKRFGWLRRKWVAIPLIILLVLLAGAGYLIYRYFDFQRDTQVGVPPVAEVPEGRPFNALLVGSDSRLGLSEKEQQDLGADDEDAAGPITGERADTLILAHIVPETNEVTMVQFPRDLYVPVASGGKAKINSALEDGRENLKVTVEDLTGLKINKYVQINIAGFRDLIEAIDGVDVCIPERIPFDSATGIEVKEPGMIHFDGDRAIRFVRSRKVFAGGDFARIQNQQKFISAAIAKMTSSETLFHLDRIGKILDIAGRNLRTSESPLGLLRLGERFRSFDPGKYEAYTVPNLGTRLHPEAGDIVVPDVAAMKRMFETLANHESPAGAGSVPGVDPDDISVGVYNGTTEEGVAAAAARKLIDATTTSLGSITIDSGDIANAKRSNYRRTVVVYEPARRGAKRKAQLIAAALPAAEIETGRTQSDVDVAVIVGRRPFETERVIQIRALPLPRAGALPAVCRT